MIGLSTKNFTPIYKNIFNSIHCYTYAYDIIFTAGKGANQAQGRQG